MRATLEIKAEGISQKLGTIMHRLDNLQPAMQRIGRDLVSLTQKRIDRGVPPPNAPLTVAVKRGSKTLRDSGRLYSSITYDVDSHGVKVGTNVRYAAIQQFGGTIRAKGKSLAIPASAYTRTLMRKHGASPKEAIDSLKKSGWKIWTSKSGGAILGKKGKRGKVRVLFILRRSVTIPARPFLKIESDEKSTVLYHLTKYLLKG